jgi:SAM-dependent methyltransferase
VIDPARSFDRSAEAYEATRPSYPDEVLGLVPVPEGATVLDVGAGTGKLTRLLVRRYAEVIAVEPLDGMRGILERVVPQARALPGRAEDLPLPDAAVDAVFAAQAFHWFANDEAVSEIARVLRPGGTLCLVWNEPDDDRPSPLPEPFLAYLHELRAERSVLDEDLSFADVIGRGPFGEVHEGSAPHDHVLDRDGLVANASSVSWIASRDEDEREAVLARLASLLPEGTYAVPNRANVLWAVRE